MKHLVRILMLCLFLGLLLLPTACTPGGETDGTQPDTVPDTGPAVPTDTEALTKTVTDTPTEAPTEAPTEEPTEAVTEDPNIIPEISDASIGFGNVADEGWAMAGSTKAGTNILLNDGSTATGFESGEFDKTDVDTYVFIELDKPYKLHSVVLLPMDGRADAFPRSFDVLVSDDFVDWTTVETLSYASDPDADGITVDMGGVTATYVKLQVNALSDGRKTYAIGEMQVMADISLADNLVLRQEDVWLYIDTSVTLERSHLRIANAQTDAPLRFMTADSSIVTVDHETGVVTPVGYGDTLVYAYDGTNLTACKVKVIDERDTAVRISTFYHSNFGHPAVIPSCMDYMKEAGIGFLEETRTYDRVGNQVCDWMMHLCAQRGILYSVSDPLNSAALLDLSDEEIVALVQKYENRAGFGGIYLVDEPHEESNGYAHVASVIHAYNHHVTPHLNLLPIGGFPSWDEYVNDYCAVAGGPFRMQYLSYDNYCFMAGGGFNWGVYNSLNKIRKAGLMYNASTGYYMQCMEITGAYRISSDTELLLNASMGIAYGMKNFKWFVYLTPIGSGEAFTTGMMDKDFKPSVMYEGVKAANEKIREVGSALGRADAIEVYHSNAVDGNEVVPADFVITQTTKNEAIYSLYEDWDGSRQYVVIVNRNFAKNGDREFSFKTALDCPSVEILSDGDFIPVKLGLNDDFTLLIPAGDCVVLRLPEGYDARRPAVSTGDNLALGCAAYVSSSQYTFWTDSDQSAFTMTDGDKKNGCWVAGNEDKTPVVILDLRETQRFSCIRLGSGANRFPASVTIEVSTDGTTWTQIFTADDMKADKYTDYVINVDETAARYIRFNFDKRAIRLAEIEVYQ